MLRNRIFFPLAALSAAFPFFVASASAEIEGSLTHVRIGDADLDDGGELGVSHSQLSMGFDRSLGGGASLGLSLEASFQDYDFAPEASLGLGSPWGDVAEYTAGASWRRPVGENGLLFIVPSIGFARGEGADWVESLTFGTIVSYGHRVSDTLTIGFGAGAFYGLEETSAFPVLLVDWQINDSWRVGNPFRPGPTGPAGLEVVYSSSEDWEAALGGGWRSNRFRLDEDGPNPDGIGEVEGVPVFVRLTWFASESTSLDLYAGQFLSGEVTVENRKGKQIASDDLESAPLIAIGMTSRF